jgi:hypothetical protein
MVGEEVVVEGSDVSEETLEAVICNHLDLPPPEPQKPVIIQCILVFLAGCPQ